MREGERSKEGAREQAQHLPAADTHVNEQARCYCARPPYTSAAVDAQSFAKLYAPVEVMDLRPAHSSACCHS
jgi:hypothetical protein